MRKSKYDQSSLPVQNSKDIDKDNNISKIENRVEQALLERGIL